MAVLDQQVRALLDGRNFPIVATVDPDGTPRSSVVWIKRDGDELLFFTLAGRTKERNLSRDPRISVSVFGTANPYFSAEIRGTAKVTREGVDKLAAELGLKYLGAPNQPADGLPRVVVRIAPESVAVFRN